MLAFDQIHNAAMALIPEPALRFWIRVWQDGLYPGAHPEWTFSPLAYSGLARIWPLFLPDEKNDYGRAQRRAIRTLVRLKQASAEGRRFPAPKTDDDALWTEYWTRVRQDARALRSDLIRKLQTEICDTTAALSYADVTDDTATLVALLLSAGHSDVELFARAAGALDPKGKRSESPRDRVRGLLGYLADDRSVEFLAWTSLLQDGKVPSANLAKKIASLRLESVDAWTAADGFARIGPIPVAVTRCLATHSATAVQRHRLQCSEMLLKTCATLKTVSLHLASETQVRRCDYLGTGMWTYAPPAITPFQYLPPPNPHIETKAFAAALNSIQDNPEETLRLLCDAFEKQLGSMWPLSAGRAYRKSLRRSLARRLLITLQETRDRWGNSKALPSWLMMIPKQGNIDFSEVAKAVRNASDFCDELLAQRLESIANLETRFSTYRDVIACLFLAKGIRNGEVHHGS